MQFLKAAAMLLNLSIQGLSLCIDTNEPGSQILISESSLGSPVTPSVISQWSSASVKYNITFGLISVYNGQASSSTLLTFNFPPESRGKTCTFNLYLERVAAVCPSGSAPTNAKCSGTFALFSSSKPAAPNAGSNFRDQWVGVLKAETSNNAAWVQPSSNPVRIPCPVGTAGFELAPQGDFDYVYFPWSPGAKSVPSFTYG